MRILVTAGPTRERLDPVRFLTNASSGRMGCAVAEAAARAGHDVTLLLGRGATATAAGVRTVPFDSVADLAGELDARFAACDALVMAAAVGDFRPDRPSGRKLSRRAGPIVVRLLPTPDLLAGVAAARRADQRIVAFAVEDGPEADVGAKARRELAEKNADCVVVNTPAAMGAAASRACILTADRVILPWADRGKDELAAAIVDWLESVPDPDPDRSSAHE